MIHKRITEYGFEYGAAKITRWIHDEKKGWVIIGLETPKGRYQIYVTKTGKVRFLDEKTHTELKGGEK